MTIPMPACEEVAVGKCPGHSGKFQSCRDEAIYEMSLDQYADPWVEDTGSTDFEGHFVLMFYPETWLFTLDPEPNIRQVLIPPGWYFVEHARGGAVFVARYNTDAEDAVREIFDKFRRGYERWTGTEDY